MSSSYLAAELYGIGQLISHLKRFNVPAHQRNYSWTREQVAQFLMDIKDAMDGGASDYFVGLLVLLTTGDEVTNWEILDGQQRLATTSMLFSAIRFWLAENGFTEDAEQIESDYLAVRRLGGSSMQRMTLNVINRDLFNNFVVERRSLEEIKHHFAVFPKNTSNYLLMDAISYCFNAISEIAAEAGDNIQQNADRLFRLASFLELQVRVVSLKLASPDDAYIVFESLNYRGNELSALDLVKNHIFSLTRNNDRVQVENHWAELSDHIDASNADDFLRLFWTSQFGRVQKRQLFPKIRQEFDTASRVVDLAASLANGGTIYSALEDETSELWYNYDAEVRECIKVLEILRSKQTRMIVFAAIPKFKSDLSKLLRGLITLTVRYQTVGKRRTGALEIGCASVAKSIGDGQMKDVAMILEQLYELLPPRSEFCADFEAYSEKNTAKIAYILFELEKTIREFRQLEPLRMSVMDVLSKFQVTHLFPMGTIDLASTNSIANWVLIEPELNFRLQAIDDLESRQKLFRGSCFALTASAVTSLMSLASGFEGHKNFLAGIAASAWRLPRERSDNA